MKGNEEVIARLNARLAEELTAINQYFVQGEVCDDWGYKQLHDAIRARSIQEMKHAEKLIERIIFLEGIPIVSNLNKINVGSDVEAHHRNDLQLEYEAIKGYNADIRFAAEVGDNGTRELLQSILDEEEMHVDWIEAQLDQINQVGIENYLPEQIH